MEPDPHNPHQELRASWDANAAAWTDSVRSNAIASRAMGTDEAALLALAYSGADRILDVGCGEGWLVRAVKASGMSVASADLHGFDGSAELVAAAQAAGGGHFFHLTYEDAAADPLRLGGPYDAAIANFSLLGAALEPLLRALWCVVRPGGQLFVQTLHPFNVEPPCESGWRTETFAGMGEGYAAPMPWYFHTFGGWVALLTFSGWRLTSVEEPLHSETGRPLSLLLTAERDAFIRNPMGHNEHERLAQIAEQIHGPDVHPAAYPRAERQRLVDHLKQGWARRRPLRPGG